MKSKHKFNLKIFISVYVFICAFIILSLVWQVLKEVIQVFVPVVALIIAWMGLSTWKRKLEGTDEHKIRQDLLRAVYNYRNAIQSVRNPAFNFKEPPERQNVRDEYERRWNYAEKVKVELDTVLVDAEIIWGDKIKEKYNELITLSRELLGNIHLHLLGSKFDYSVLFDKFPSDSKDTTGENNIFTEKLNGIVKSIKEEMKINK